MTEQRGELRVYLGAAPGVGKTFAMLGEGRRRAERGTDVVVGIIEDHGRPQTRAMVGPLEVLPRRQLPHRGAYLEELDVPAVLRRHPAVVLVDELAHTNAAGSAHEKRWQDVDEILDAGIDVVTTVNVQHLESLNDVVRLITGIEQHETIPDHVVRGAAAIELVDMSPESLRRRIAHGNVYASGKVDAALSNWFRVGNLTALRELALLWVADRVDDALQRYRAEHDIVHAWPARERVVVALTGGPEGEELIRNAARIAGRAAGGELQALYVARGDGVASHSPAQLVAGLDAQRKLVESFGGTFHTAVGEDVATAILQFANAVNATQIVLGLSRRSRLAAVLSRGVGEQVIAGSGDIDVHVVTHPGSRGRSAGVDGPHPARRRGESVLGRRRQVAGWIAAFALPLGLALALSATVSVGDLSLHLMLFLAATVAVALIGGVTPALACALVGGACVDYFFTEPTLSFDIRDTRVFVAVAVFVVVAVAVALVVDQAARRSQQADRAEREAHALSVLTGTMARSGDALDTLLNRVRETFGMRSAALLERRDPRAAWTVRAAVGDSTCTAPDQGDVAVPVSDTLSLVASGRVLPAADRRLLEAFARQASTVLEERRLRADAEDARRLADRNVIRTALLAAVSHDLRTPLAAIKAAASGLRQTDIDLSPSDTAELLADIESGSDRLDAVVGNLLDMSRLRMGDLVVRRDVVAVQEVVERAALAFPSPLLAIEVGEDTPPVLGDAGLLERVVANLLQNALRHAPGSAVTATASTLAGRLELRVVDHGPGVPRRRRQLMFSPFTRLGAPGTGGEPEDPGTGAQGGVGLGLAVAKGFVEAMAGHLTVEDTPGGGLTFVIDLPLTPAPGVSDAAVAPAPGAAPVPVPAPVPAALVRS